jgi:AAA15 family ATPase/GTPase
MPVPRSNIKTIYIQNFKFFSKPEKVELDGNHLLLYGENGSGKSSLYWALYTLLECANKQDENEIKKYFNPDPANTQKLTNIFLVLGNPDWVDSEIKFELMDGTSLNVSFANTVVNGNVDAKNANYATEFLNYKMLFRLHNFAHSDNIDLFPYFEREVLPYVKFSPVKYWLKKSDGTPDVEKETENAKEIWDFVRNGPPKTGVTASGKKRYSLRKEPESKVYFNIIYSFRRELDQLLTFINTEANPILQNELKYPLTFKLQLSTRRELKLTSLQFHHPQHEIRLDIPDFIGQPGVTKAHSFLNEARLSAIGLAIRFAILKRRLQDSKLKMAILDDFMISLDMRNREVALDYILDKIAPNYQLLILTHDRFLYEMINDEIQRKDQTNWKRYQMFEAKSNGQVKLFPQLIKDEGKVNKADALFRLNDLASSAHTLRLAAEKFCRAFLTPQEQLGGDYRPMNLDGWIVRSIAKGTAAGIDAGLLRDLRDYKDRIMNPNVHYDIQTPQFAIELERAIGTMRTLSAITGIQL